MNFYSIKYRADGQITNRYNGRKGGDWTQVAKDEWPVASPDSDERAVYYYDEESDEVYVDYKDVLVYDEPLE